MTISNSNRRKLFLTFISGAIAFTSLVFAQTTARTSESLPGIPAEQLNSAFADLSQVYGQAVSTVAKARAVCNQEKYLDSCIAIGKKYSLYSKEDLKTVDVVVNELKGKVSDDIRNCQSEDCLVSVANDLAKKLVAKNPDLATKLDLTPKKVEEKKVILAAAKDAGVNFSDCQSMDPDTASLDLLRSCARLAKDSRVAKYIPEERKADGAHAEKTVELKEALAKKEIACGDGTLESCGNFCLNPSPDVAREGVSAIPQVCRQIAEKFFGVDGIRQLESSYRQVGAVSDQYVKKIENSAFTTIDGKTLANPAEIGRYLEEEGKKGNVEAVAKGMDFMVDHGFIKPEEKDYALKFVQKVRDTGNQVDFSVCEKDPRSCQKFVPDAHKDEFEVLDQVQQVLGKELGFDSKECRRGEFDHDIAIKCFEGSKRALPQLEALSVKSAAAAQIVSDLKAKIVRGEEAINNSAKFEQNFKNENGPGGCASEAACRSYCSDPAHGPECIAYGAKAGVFRADEIAQRLDQYNARLAVPQSLAVDTQFRGNGPYEGFRPPGQGGIAPGQIAAFREPGRGFGSSVTPECLAAIQLGDFAKAKAVCEVSREATTYSDAVRPVIAEPACSAAPDPAVCANQPDTFPSRGQNCETVCVRKYVQPQPYPIEPPRGDQNFPHIEKIYPASGPIGSKVVIYGYGFEASNRINFDVGIIPGVSSADGGRSISLTVPGDRAPACAFTDPRCLLPAPYNPVKPGSYDISVTTSKGTSNRFTFVVSDTVVPTPVEACPPNYYRYYPPDGGPEASYCKPTNQDTIPCPSGTYRYYPTDGTPSYCKSSETKQCDWSIQYLKVSTNVCLPKYNCTDTANAEYNSSECAGVRNYSNTSTTTGYLDWKKVTWGSGGSSYVPPTTSQADIDARIAELKNNCPNATSYYYANGADTTRPNPGFPSCPSTTVTATSTQPQPQPYTDCASKYGTGWHTMDSSGRCFNPDMTKYHNSDGTEYSCVATYVYGCSSSNTSSTTYVTCPAGQFQYNGACVNNCSSNQYWNGTSCVNNVQTSTAPAAITSNDCSTKFGSGWHIMDDGRSWRCFELSMNSYKDYSNGTLYSCTTNYIYGCATTTATSTSNSQTCSSNQYWYVPSGGTGYCKTYETNTTSGTTTSGTYYSTSSPSYTQQTTCPSGQFWTGSACVTNCSSNQYWNGTSCVSNITTSCSSGQYWNGAACVSNTSGGTTDPATGCANYGGTWDGAQCSCPAGQKWGTDGHCTVATNTLGSRMFASVQYSLESLGEWFVGMFR